MKWLFLLLFPFSAHAWTGATHHLLVDKSLASVATKWNLNAPVVIVPFENFLVKLAKENPKIQTRADFAEWLQINSAAPFDALHKSEIPDHVTTPLQILSITSPRPDDGRDRRLAIDHLEQFWFGRGTKTVSQAFRHMEKVPFDLLHPLNTFGFPPGPVGQATQRAQIYFDLALLAHRLEEPYWAWNFLGCALHYIEDLQQPFHSSQLIPPLAWKGLQSYFRWGFQEKNGFLKTLTHIASNTHHYFEGYVEMMLGGEHDAPLSTGALWNDALKGKDIFEKPLSARELAKNIRDFSNRYVYDTVEAVLKLTDGNLLGPKIYTTDFEDGPPENPTLFFNPDVFHRTDAAAQISRIVLTNFKYQGTAIRTIVRSFLNQTESKQGG